MPENLKQLTQDGLPVVSAETFLEVVTSYPIASADNSTEVRERIEKENPQIARIIGLGMSNASDKNAAIYYETGCQLTYELLRRQSAARIEEMIRNRRAD